MMTKPMTSELDEQKLPSHMDTNPYINLMKSLRYTSLKLTQGMPLSEILESILLVIFDLLPRVNSAHIFLYDEKNNALTPSAVIIHGTPSKEPFAIPRPNGVTANAARARHRIVISDIAKHELYQDVAADKGWQGALVAVPLTVSDSVVGVMNISLGEVHDFTGYELEMLDLFALQAALAIENSRLYEEAQGALDALEKRHTQDIAYYQELNRTKDLLLDTASHDLKNPLSMIRGYIGLLHEDLANHSDPQIIFFLDRVQDGVEQMMELIRRLLDLAKFETGLNLSMEPIMTNDLLENTVNKFGVLAEPKKITLAYSPLPRDNCKLIDRVRAQQVMDNLVSNAIKYTPKGGNISLSAHADRQSQMVTFVVKDTGMGIPAEDLPYIFDKFRRVKAHQDIEGTGLGLSIVKAIVSQYGGTIRVESEVGEGSTFYVTLPYTPDHPSADDKQE